MQEIKTLEDVGALRSAGQHPAALLDLAETRMKEVINAFKEDADEEWTAEEYGTFYIIEQGDDVRHMGAAGLNPEDGGLVGAPFEVVQWHPEANAFDCLVLFSNDGGNTYLVPDAPWLDPELRTVLRAEAATPWWQRPSPTSGEVPF